MKKLVLLLSIFLLGSLAMFAQENDKVEVFGGYSYLNANTAGAANRYSLNGWNAQTTYNVNRWLGATADFGGYYGSPFSASAYDHSFLFGPTISIRTPRFTPYVHALFGVNRLSSTALGTGLTDTAFAMAYGGGLDVPVKQHVALRLAQVDWLRAENFSGHANDVRVSTGVQFHFGK